MWSDFYNARREAGIPIGNGGGDRKSFMMSNVRQEASPQWVESVMRYLEAQKTGRVPPQ